MFDDIFAECDLPVDLGPQARHFQTRSLYRAMVRFTITKGGRLIHHAARYVPDPGPPNASLRLVPVDQHDIDMNFHGDILISSDADGKPVDYVVRFTHGQLEWIRPFAEFSETERAVVVARNLET